MKKLIFLSFIMLCVFSVARSQYPITNGEFLVSEVKEARYSPLSTWLKEDSSHFTQTNPNTIRYSHYLYSHALNNWEHLFSRNITLRPTGGTFTDISQRLVNGVYRDYSRVTNTFLNNDPTKPLSITGDTFQNATNTWVPFWRYVYTYDSNSKVTEISDEKYVAGAYQPQQRTIYTYNAAGLVIVQQNLYYVNGINTSESRATNTYNASNQLESAMYESFIGSQLQSRFRYWHAYDNAGLNTYSSCEEWSYQAANGTYLWEEKNRFFRTFNAAGSQISEVQQFAFQDSTAAPVFLDVYFKTFVRNANNNITLELYDVIPFGTGQRYTRHKITRTYTSLSSIASAEEKGSDFSIFPNPALDFINVQGPKDINAQAKIFNTMGQVIKTFTLNQENQHVDVSEMPSGTYFLMIEQSEGTNVLKFVK